jgi:hypothetical protein
MMEDGRAGHCGLTERPILNELNVIVAEGAEKGSKVIVYSSEELARELLTVCSKIPVELPGSKARINLQDQPFGSGQSTSRKRVALRTYLVQTRTAVPTATTNCSTRPCPYRVAPSRQISNRYPLYAAGR